MNKHFYLLLLISNLIFAQGTNAVDKIYPAAPTANNLMKFEEVPVSTYTGVPDISIPIYSLKNGNIQVPVSLKYHTLSAKPDDASSEVGLGWNLIAGGSIVRTVKGLPDEAVNDNLSNGYRNLGIYIDEYSNVPNYNSPPKNYAAKYIDIASNGGSFTLEPTYPKMAFESVFQNRYDTQYDLYQYNFLGRTGRFIIKKDQNNNFTVVKLDKNNLKITSLHNNKYEPISFTVIDETGHKYIFGTVETTERSYFNTSVLQLTNSYSANIGQIDKYNSSFHLSSILKDNLEIANFEYNLPLSVTYSETSTKTNSAVYPNNIDSYVSIQVEPYLPPKNSSNTVNSTSMIRSLKNISILGGDNLEFIYVGDRQDTGFSHLPFRLQSILVKNSTGIVETCDLIHDYFSFQLPSELAQNKLLLKEVVKKTPQGNLISKHVLNYKLSGIAGGLNRDSWGYFKCRNFNFLDESRYGNDGCSDTGVLQSIKLPTGGLVNFQYETNTFSHTPNDGNIVNFYENPKNWIFESSSLSFNKFKDPPIFYFTINKEQDVKFNYDMSSIPNIDWRLELFKTDGILMPANNAVPDYMIGSLYNNSSASTGSVIRNLPPGHYYARLDTDDGNMMFQTFNSVSIGVEYASQLLLNDQENFLYGGGIRVKNISYTNELGAVVKEKHYDYTNGLNPKSSSGSLVFPVPVKNYVDGMNEKLWYEYTSTGYFHINYSNSYRTISSKNLLPVLKTRGGDIGYERVGVYETEKGMVTSYYKSPRLHPNSDVVNMAPPFFPITDEDYKRGDMEKEEVKDNVKMLSEKKLSYQTTASDLYIGINFLPTSTNPYLGEYVTYEDYVYRKQNCYSSMDGIECGKIWEAPILPAGHVLEKSILATVNHSQTITKEFQGSSTSNFVLSKESKQYNSLDLPIKNTLYSSDNNVTETTYSYAHEKNNQYLIGKNMVGIPLETTVIKKSDSLATGKQISKSEILYPISQTEADQKTSGLALPYETKSSFANAPLSTDVTYDKYDDKGNILQYTSKDGVPTTIVWGYNKTQPIAKIVGAAYSNVSSLIGAIVDASNTDAQNPSTEPALIAALDSFRKNSNIVNFQVTTYTYDPLIGVTSITPPSGIREVYLYDSANRLKEIRENSATGKLIKEFKYNYKQ
ncbi:hypothetical protein [Chryseobacterium sp.]|uniref:hypothetical protein n=1 Tax=Chryseobacterium sp. TaxID=1871047 RepID=UPI00289DC26F|nr:hypothetical protein [Chryseobacterium sp.]